MGSLSVLAKSIKPPAVLLVDDHPANLLALETVLEPLGFRLGTASSGTEALGRLLEDDYVLILMDVHMPGLDGYETVTLIRERQRCRDIPVIFLTAVYDQPEHTRRGYALGAVDYVTKPFDPEVLRGKVRALVTLYTRGERAERARAEEAERIKDVFLGAVGHDLRNPLGAIVLGSQLIQRDPLAKPAHARHAVKIERAARRMAGIIEDIVDLTRDQFTGGIAIAPCTTNLEDICRAVVDESRLGHPDREIQLELSGDLAGFWDPDRIGRVLSNLLGNAVEHGAGGAVRVRAVGEVERVLLEFHNRGAPIDPEELPRLFEPFHRGDRSRHGHGLGLGLYIVSQIVRAHGGSVRVSSTLEEGTTFSVVLPRRAVSAPPRTSLD